MAEEAIKDFFCRNGQRHADGMPAAEHEGNRGLFHARNQLREGEPRLDIPAHRVEQNEQSLNILAFLNRHELRHNMLVVGGFVLGRQGIMPLDLADNGQAVDHMAPVVGRHRPVLHHVLKLLLYGRRLMRRGAAVLVVHIRPFLSCVCCALVLPEGRRNMCVSVPKRPVLLSRAQTRR